MTSTYRHQDNVPATFSFLPENSNGNMAKEREGQPSLSHECVSHKCVSEVNAEEKPRKPHLLIIREELVDLTGDPLTAGLLCQLLHRSQKTSDFDLYLEEEKSPQSSSSSQYGWFYKSKRELMEETMLRVTLATFRRYLNFLRCRGWIQTRRDPHNKLSSKVQYRVSLRKLHIDLQRKGHTVSKFEIYRIFPSVQHTPEPKRAEGSLNPHQSAHSKGRCS